MTYDNSPKNPIPIVDDLSIEELVKLRFFNCPHYDECLDLACAGDWISFICSKCKIFKKRHLNEYIESNKSSI